MTLPPPDPESPIEAPQEGNGAMTDVAAVTTNIEDTRTKNVDEGETTEMASSVVDDPVVIYLLGNTPVGAPFPLQIYLPPPLPPPLLSPPPPLISPARCCLHCIQ